MCVGMLETTLNQCREIDSATAVGYRATGKEEARVLEGSGHDFDSIAGATVDSLKTAIEQTIVLETNKRKVDLARCVDSSCRTAIIGTKPTHLILRLMLSL
jgi:hypothetical protein